MSLYLKAATVVLMKYYGDEPTLLGCPAFYPFPISLTQDGLPSIIPAFHRRVIWVKDHRASRVVKFYLSLFSVYRLIRIPTNRLHRWNNIVGRRECFSDRSNSDLLTRIGSQVSSLMQRYAPWYLTIPVHTGWRWIPAWVSIPEPSLSILFVISP